MSRREPPEPPDGASRRSSLDVRVWQPRQVVNKTRTSWECRWRVGPTERSKTFATRALALSFASDLRAATNRGEPFDLATGLPLSQLPEPASAITWWEWTIEFVDLKWFDAAPRTRQSTAEALVTATMAMLDSAPDRARAPKLRAAMMHWAYNTTRRRAEPDPPESLAADVGWLARHSLRLDALNESARTRALLDALGRLLDGGKASPTTVARKVAVVHNALELAVEHEHFRANPMDRVKRVAPKAPERVDPRVVINHSQARALLAAVAATPRGDRLVAFYALIYYSALRPGEALDVRESDLALPDPDDTEGDGWGVIHVGRSNPEVARAWTDAGKREGRQLKHRARGEIRSVPIPPPLVAILRDQLATWQISEGAPLFAGPRGGHLGENTYSAVWRRARETALTPAEYASPLAARPYDLRHAAVSTWLAAGVDSAQVAAWAGHSVAVLHRVYAQIISGRSAAARRLITNSLDR